LLFLGVEFLVGQSALDLELYKSLQLIESLADNVATAYRAPRPG
jgi:hypothetical protein